MSRQTCYSAIALATLQLSLTCVGCRQSILEAKPWQKGEVEIAPGSFMEIEERSVSSDEGAPPVSFRDLHVFGTRKQSKNVFEVVELRFFWNGTNVHWKGSSVPLSLRSHEGRVFLIAFDRVSKGIEECEFRYFAQDGIEMKEIPYSQFPKAIAGQNLDFGHRYFGGLDRQRDAVQIARDLDPGDIYFRRSLTAYIWNHLTTGQQYSRSSKAGEIDRTLLEDYIRTNTPVRLCAIIRNRGIGESKSQGYGERRAPNVPNSPSETSARN